MRWQHPSLGVCLLVLTACQGEIGGSGRPEDAGPPSGDVDGFVIPPECGTAGEAIVYFERTCAANGACHQPGGRFPDLTRAGLVRLPELNSRLMEDERLVVPGNPEASWLYRKMAGLQGEDGGGLMPAGRRGDWDELPDDVVFVRDWIQGGAPATCEALPPVDLQYDPNTLDRDALFTCADPSAPRASPARYRRVERLELTHAVGRRMDGRTSSVIDNPLVTPVHHPYATYSDDVTLDPATLSVLTLSMPEASELWTQEELSSDVLRSAELRCIYEDVAPSSECIDGFVDTLMRHGTHFRTPTDWEHQHLRGLVERAIGREGGIADRTATIRLAFQSAMLASGGMFRAELPEASGETRMSGEALGVSLARLLSTHPLGSLKISSFEGLAADPDSDDIEGGWFAAIADAAAIPAGESGSIHDPEVRRAMVLRYFGGVDPDRAFWQNDEAGLLAAGNPVGPGRLGEFWITGEMVRFFRQWLDYEDADTVFKDTPAATSAYETGWDMIDSAYAGLQGGGSREGRLTHQLDDWIARLVVETHSGAGDFWHELMAGRQWHLPATGEGPACTTVDDCTMTYATCTRFGDCRNTSGTVRRPSTNIALVFSVEDQILGTQADRWVTVPESERRGVLTHPTWLGAHGGNFEDDASLVHRGKWIREHIFCETVPPLTFVEVEAQLIPSAPELGARERVHLSTDHAECRTCHSLMNPLGNMFELFNHAGYFRADDHGSAPDGSTTLDNLPTGAGEDLNGDYATPFAFAEALADSRLARRGFIRHAFRYFMGRDETMADACTLVEMEAAFDGGSFVDMIAALAASDTFARRSVEGDDR